MVRRSLKWIDEMLLQHKRHNEFAHFCHPELENVKGCRRCSLEKMRQEVLSRPPKQRLGRIHNYKLVYDLAMAGKNMDEIVFITKIGNLQVRRILKIMGFKGRVPTVRNKKWMNK